MMLERAALKSQDPEGLDWRSEGITEIFGRVNLIAARLYRDRVDQVVGERHGNRRNAYRFACIACIEMHLDLSRYVHVDLLRCMHLDLLRCMHLDLLRCIRLDLLRCMRLDLLKCMQ